MSPTSAPALMPSASGAGAAELAEGGGEAASAADGLDPEVESGQVGSVGVIFVRLPSALPAGCPRLLAGVHSWVAVICRVVSRGSLQHSLPELLRQS